MVDFLRFSGVNYSKNAMPNYDDFDITKIEQLTVTLSPRILT